MWVGSFIMNLLAKIIIKPPCILISSIKIQLIDSSVSERKKEKINYIAEKVIKYRKKNYINLEFLINSNKIRNNDEAVPLSFF